jgi:hypothetical protein
VGTYAISSALVLLFIFIIICHIANDLVSVLTVVGLEQKALAYRNLSRCVSSLGAV